MHMWTCAHTRVQGAHVARLPPPLLDSVVPVLEATECGEVGSLVPSVTPRCGHASANCLCAFLERKR